MKKIFAFAVLVILIFAMSTTAFAVTGASAQQNHAAVASDGSCHVSIAVTLHMEQAVNKVYFPVPAGATGISVNGSRVLTSKNGDAKQINISRFTKNVVGDISLNIQYTLYGLVKETDIGTLQLELPLMNGFDYSVSSLSFTVSLPGEIKTLPAFSSGYHQTNIEQDLTYTVEGSTITGSSVKAMKDHETLIMTLVVDKEMFPQVLGETESTQAAAIGMGVCAALAVIYWLLTLRTFPWPRRSSEMPDGYTAGQLGCIVATAGADLSLMVLGWAQLGYVTVYNKRGKVSVYKRMDMGNERSEFERRVFKKLFNGRSVVDTAGIHYATLRSTLLQKPASVAELMHKHNGSNRIFRILAAGMGVFAGGGIGMLLGSGAALQWLLIIFWGALGGISGWAIQDWTDGTMLHNKEKAVIAAGVSVFWLIMGLVVENFPLAGWFVLGSLIAGILFAIGGRRTEGGRYTRSQVLGLRQHLLGTDREFFKRMQENDPDYFFRMAPYAIALGVGRPFAKAMGGVKLEGCSYLQTGNDIIMSAIGWNTLFEKTIKAMDARSKNLSMEKIMKILSNLRR